MPIQEKRKIRFREQRIYLELRAFCNLLPASCFLLSAFCFLFSAFCLWIIFIELFIRGNVEF